MLAAQRAAHTGVSLKSSSRPASVPVVVSRKVSLIKCHADDVPSTSGSAAGSSAGPRIGLNTAWQRLVAPVGLFSASCMSGFIMIPGFGAGGHGGNNWFGGGGGGGGGGSGGPGGQGGQALYDLAADDKDVSDLTEEAAPGAEAGAGGKWKDLITPTDDVDAAEGQRAGTNRCVEVVIEGWPEAGALPKKDELQDMLSVQEGHIFDYQDIVDDRRRLETTYDEYIANVEIRTEFVDDKTNHQRVVYKFTPYVFTGIDDIQIKGASLMPAKVQEQIIRSCMPENVYKVDIGVMDKVREKIEKWYQDRGLPFCYVGFFDGMEEGRLCANVIEAKINDVDVRYNKMKAGDESEDTEYEGGRVVPPERIIAAAGFKKGEHYHLDDGYDAMNNVYACGLLEDVNIEPEQDMQDPSKINVHVVVNEVEPRSLEMDLDWTFQMKGALPQLSRQSLIPGGSIELSHENLFGDSQSLSVSLSSSDWRNPGADLGFQCSYTEPFYAPNTTRNVQVFNTRKLSPVFTSPVENEVPPVFVDRLGCKAWTSHVGGQDNKVEHALILQQVTTCDENGQTVAKGSKVSRGYYADNGPATTLSGNGKDYSLSYQHFTALDDVQFVNGNQLGTRMLFQVDQGLNLKVPLPGGKSFGLSGGLFNRTQASITKFMQLPFTPKLSMDDVWVKRKAPNSLVLHARAGNCIGDMASYDYFTLGGPYSVRGYTYGELGAARRFVETAAEVRVPLKNYGLPGTAYAFAEYGTDLGSSRALEGNPTEYYRKPGHGMSYGAGIKVLGACRFEYARDCNAGTGALFINWGERY